MTIIAHQSFMIMVRYIFLAIILSLSSLSSVTAAEQQNTPHQYSLNLTVDEQAWIEKHPVVKVGTMDAWPPFNFIDIKGSPSGIGRDLIKALNKRLGGILEIVPGSWKNIYEDTKEKKLDCLFDITPKPEREKFFNFTTPYLDVPHVIIAQKETPYMTNEDDLIGKSLALEQGFGNVKYFQNNYPQIHIKEYLDTKLALDAVSRGEADAYAGNRGVALYLISKEVMTNLKAHGRLNKSGSILAIGCRKDSPILRDILQKALDDIDHVEMQNILTRWVDSEENNNQITKVELAASEKEWIGNHPVIRLGVDQSWPPVEWIDEHDRYQGVASDHMNIITEMLGIQIEPVKRMTWAEVLEKTKRRELDILPALMSSPERSKFLNFTKPYLNFPFVIFTLSDSPFIAELNDLNGKTVAVENGYASYEYLKKDYPKIKLTTYKTTNESLKALSLGKVDAYVGSLTVASYIIKKSGYTNIKVAAPTPYNGDLSIGVRKDWPEMIPILEKALLMIDEEQRNEIRQKWMAIEYEVGVDYRLVKRGVTGAALIIFFILLWVFFVHKKEQMLRVAKAETDRANEAFQHANEQLIAANVKLKEMDQLKSMFIASMSHELRTPLNSIIGFTGIILKEMTGPLNDKQKDHLGRVYNSAKHLLTLITDVIDISKIEAGRIDSYPEDIILSEIVDDAVINIEPQLKTKSLALEVSVPPDLQMFTDRKRLLQCLINYLSNAVKFTEVGRVSLTARKIDDKVEILVSDTGIGISAQDQTKLFEAFERLESHLRVKVGGTGLGLYLTRKLVTEILGGNILVQSQEGKGSTFGLLIPMKLNPVTLPEESIGEENHEESTHH